MKVLIKNTDLDGKPLESEGEVFAGKTSFEVIRDMMGTALFSDQSGFEDYIDMILHNAKMLATRDDRIDIDMFKVRLELCRGQMTAVLASQLDPETVLLLKGNEPLELRVHRRYRVVIYASDPAFLYAVLADGRVWRELSGGGSFHEHDCVQTRGSHGVLKAVSRVHRPGNKGGKRNDKIDNEPKSTIHESK